MSFSNQRPILIFLIIILLLISIIFYISGLLIFGSIAGLNEEVNDLHSQFNQLKENLTNSNLSGQTTTPNELCVRDFTPSNLPLSIDASIFRGLDLTCILEVRLNNQNLVSIAANTWSNECRLY